MTSILSLLATERDYLARKGMPFRQAHKVVGRIVFCVESGSPLTTLSLEKLRTFSDLFEDDVTDVFSFEGSISRRLVAGGTGRESVCRQIETACKLLS